MTGTSHLALKANGLLKPELAIKTEPTVLGLIFTLYQRAHCLRHPTALIEWISGDAGLVRVAGAVGFCRTYPLQSDLFSRLAMDRAVNVMDGYGKTQKQHSA